MTTKTGATPTKSTPTATNGNRATRRQAARKPADADPAKLTEALTVITTTAAQLEQQVSFWKQKYFEQLLHSTQVIAALNQPMVTAVQQHAQQAAQQAAAAP